MTILDGSAEVQPAIRRAIALAREESTALVILGIDEPFDALTPDDARKIRGADDYVPLVVERELRDVARAARAAKVPLTYRRILRGHPLPALRGAIDAHQPQALVIPSLLLARLRSPEEPGSLDKLLARVQVYLLD